MELTLLASDYSPLGVISRVTGDIELGGENDFRIIIDRVDYEPLLDMFKASQPTATSIAGDMENGARIAVVGSEFGGFIGKDITDTEDETYSLGGCTYRGYLKKKIISPKPGQDYYIANGDARDVIYDLLNGDAATGSSGASFLDLIGVQSGASGLTISNYQFPRYTNMYDGIQKMLATVNAKMEIRNEQIPENGTYGTRIIVKPIMYIVPIEDYSNQIVLSQNNKYSFMLSRQYDGINHLICLGGGELASRVVVHLFADKYGAISTRQSIFGAGERMEVYDYSSVESNDELVEKGIERFRELINKEEFRMNILSDEFVANIGDYIGGKDYMTGYSIKQPITKKILRIEKDGAWSIEYSIEGSEKQEDEH